MPPGRAPTQRQTLGTSTTTRTTLGHGAPPAIRQHTEDRQVNALQRALDQTVTAMRAHPHGNGLFVQKGQAFTAGGTVTLSHGLGRAFQGYEVKNVAGNYSRFQLVANTDPALDAKQIRIQSEAACTGDVWVF